MLRSESTCSPQKLNKAIDYLRSINQRQLLNMMILEREQSGINSNYLGLPQRKK
jgi:hypothetical protein